MAQHKVREPLEPEPTPEPDVRPEPVLPLPVYCPACLERLNVEALTTIHGMAPCPQCARTLVLDGGSARLATAADTLPLSEAERNQIKALRPKAWREDVKARSMAIRGKRR